MAGRLVCDAAVCIRLIGPAMGPSIDWSSKELGLLPGMLVTAGASRPGGGVGRDETLDPMCPCTLPPGITTYLLIRLLNCFYSEGNVVLIFNS